MSKQTQVYSKQDILKTFGSVMLKDGKSTKQQKVSVKAFTKANTLAIQALTETLDLKPIDICAAQLTSTLLGVTAFFDGGMKREDAEELKSFTKMFCKLIQQSMLDIYEMNDVN